MRSLSLVLRVSVVLAMSLTVAACASPRVEVRTGAGSRAPARVVLLPPSCASLEGLCTDAFVVATGQLVAAELSFAGFVVVDAEKLVVDARTKPGIPEELRAFGERVLRAGNKRQIGSTFEDLSPVGRRALLAEAEAASTVSVRLTISATSALGREADVMIRLGAGEGDELAFVSRCTTTTSPGTDLDAAFDAAARCALGAALDLTKPAPSTTSARAPGPAQRSRGSKML